MPVANWRQAEVDGRAAPAIYTVHLTAPAYQNRVIVSARDATTTTSVAHAFFQPVPCICYADTCKAFDGSCVCHAGTDPVAMSIVLEVCLATTGICATQHPARAVCAMKRWSPRLQRAELSTLSSAFFVPKGNTDFDSEWTCKCAGSWTGPRCDRHPCPNN